MWKLLNAGNNYGPEGIIKPSRICEKGHKTRLINLDVKLSIQGCYDAKSSGEGEKSEKWE